MIPTKDELRLAREAELRAMAAQSAALLPQFEMSAADADDFLVVASPQQRAAMSTLREKLRAMTPAERLDALKELAAAALAARTDKRGKQ